ncbi:endonuclease domain-containing protein [Microbacterium sp. GXF7504]
MRTVAEFGQWLAQRSGVAHSSDARAEGWPAGVMAAAVGAGVCIRVRRSWLVAPECDPRRAAAVTVGGRVTCASAAAMFGLWTPAHDGVHVAVPGNAGRLDADGLVLHWGSGPAPVARNGVDDHLVNVLFHTARCLGRREALPIWESALRKGLVERAHLQRIAWRNAEARELARAASLLSDAGGETVFVHGMRAEGIAVRQQVWVDGHRVDGLIGDRLVIQVDGFAHHSSAADRRRDIHADARLALLGYTVLRFDYQQILFDWPQVRDTVVHAMAQGLHRIR